LRQNIEFSLKLMRLDTSKNRIFEEGIGRLGGGLALKALLFDLSGAAS
jgi:hypothetical protein